MWVWIPRFAYNITYAEGDDKAKAGTIDIVFLKGTTDQPADESENVIIKRAQDVKNMKFDNKGEIDGEKVYIVHPAFTNESKTNYENGGWDTEIPGFWMGKFEAGFAGKQDGTDATDSTLKYTSNDADSTVNGTHDDNFYGKINKNDTAIKYPIFKPNRPSFNYISIGDAYKLCRHLVDDGNPYGFTSKVDSHLTKNSEWGAAAYLSWSKYGTNRQEMVINNVNAAGIDRVMGMTGYGGYTSEEAINNEIKAIEALDGTTGNWSDDQGRKASTTRNMTGIYDMSGGVKEYTSAFVPGNGNKLFGGVLLDEDSNSKYKTGYSLDWNLTDPNGQEPKGDAIYEMPMETKYNVGSWNWDLRKKLNSDKPFICRGGWFNSEKNSRCFCTRYSRRECFI